MSNPVRFLVFAQVPPDGEFVNIIHHPLAIGNIIEVTRRSDINRNFTSPGPQRCRAGCITNSKGHPQRRDQHLQLPGCACSYYAQFLSKILAFINVVNL